MYFQSHLTVQVYINLLQDICMDKKILCAEHAGDESLSHPYTIVIGYASIM